MTLRIVDCPDAGDKERAALLAPLRDYNLSRAGDAGVAPVVFLLQDGNEKVCGGLWGRIAYDWLFVEFLVVPEESRGAGLGRELIERAEQAGRAAGCTGIWLDTFDFQAPDFYRKLGFETFGQLEDHPAGNTRHFLRKRL